ncbi:hypothetical protein [Pseudoruegeria sp. HB172150]|uniref:hypothetical protein n=1 Tax=Pseudoruegeria sp. HB172150 TaxID=2721164 RepID=UPI0015523AE5|nr:hypothetical protein [Pseudoruegeria sp. HB172150]
MRRLALLLCFALTACGHVDYDALEVGRFKGTLFVMWVGEGSDAAGDGRFVFVPLPNDPLTFERNAPGASVQTIRPQIMYTDGGSVPRIAQPLKGLSPWGYAPGYMVHDWLFVAKHCNTDGIANAAEREVARMTFQESAEVLGEAIKTLIAERRVDANDVAPMSISNAVAGPISRSLWVREGACRDPRVSEAHMRQIRNALGQYNSSPAAGLRSLAAPPTGAVAGIVSVVRFD